MKLIILGSEGFIGSHCVSHFRAKGDKITGLDLFEQPSTSYSYFKVSRLSPELDDIFSDLQFDAVINAAGSGNVPYSMQHPLQDFEANCLDAIRVLDVIRRHQPGAAYIHLSSAAVYGNPVRLPITEDDPTTPLSAYGWHKLVAEQICKEYTQVYGLKTAVVRPFSVYGPGLKKQLFWDLYKKIQTLDGEMSLFGTGKESRDYIHVSDVVHAIDLILQKGELKSEVYNLASGVETTIAEAVKYYFSALNAGMDYSFSGKVREGDPLNWRADISKIRKLGFENKVSLDKGLQEVANWIRTVN